MIIHEGAHKASPIPFHCFIVVLVLHAVFAKYNCCRLADNCDFYDIHNDMMIAECQLLFITVYLKAQERVTV